MRKLILFSFLILLIACQEDKPVANETAVSPTTPANNGRFPHSVNQFTYTFY